MAADGVIECQQKKLIKSKSGLRMVIMNESQQSPFILNEPPWMPDKEVSDCIGCKAKFSFTNRKHHCRRCGYIYCSACCTRKMWLPRMSFMDPVRVCTTCAFICEKEQDFFDNRLITLQNGATFLLSPLNSAQTTCLCLCKLTANQQSLHFDSLVNIPLVPIESITDYRISHATETGADFLELLCSNGGVRLTTGPENHRNTAKAWIEAIDQAFRLINITPSW